MSGTSLAATGPRTRAADSPLATRGCLPRDRLPWVAPGRPELARTVLPRIGAVRIGEHAAGLLPPDPVSLRQRLRIVPAERRVPPQPRPEVRQNSHDTRR